MNYALLISLNLLIDGTCRDGILSKCLIDISIVIVELDRFDLLLQPLEDNKEARYYHNLKERTDKHTADGSSTEGYVTVLTYCRWQEE